MFRNLLGAVLNPAQAAIARVIAAARRKRERAFSRQERHDAYIATMRAGGGARERARRVRQMHNEQLSPKPRSVA